MSKTTEKTSAEQQAVARFTKEELLHSKRFANRRDALAATLDAGKTYTVGEVEKAIEKFFKTEVR